MSDSINIDFDKVFKGAVAPFFKALGFKRKGFHFSRKTNDVVQCFNVQKGRWGPFQGTLSFTFNFGFYHEAIRRAAWPGAPIKDFPAVTDCFIQDRLGQFSHQRDHWYKVGSRIEVEQTESEVIRDLETFLKPLFESYTSLDSLTLFPDDKLWFFPTNHIVFMMMTEQFDKGERLIKEHYQKAITPQQAVGSIGFGTINHSYVDSIKRLADMYNISLP